jgi:hypothetical protein
MGMYDLDTCRTRLRARCGRTKSVWLPAERCPERFGTSYPAISAPLLCIEALAISGTDPESQLQLLPGLLCRRPTDPVHMLVHTCPATTLKTFRRPCIPSLCSLFRHISSTIASSPHPFHFRYYPISGLHCSLHSWYTISGHCHIQVWTIYHKPPATHHPQIITLSQTYISTLVL